MRKISVILLSTLLCVLLLSGCSDGKKKPAPKAYQPDFGRGMSVYNAHCGECHNTGRLDAPMLDEPEEWDFRALGTPGILHDHAARGFLGGPGQDAAGKLSNENIADALHYMARRINDAEERY